jgi:hypothetical protein
MRIVKKSDIGDEKARMVFDIFDKILMKLGYPWKYDVLGLAINEKTSVFVADSKITITLDYNDSLIQEMDKKGIASLILHSLYHVITKDKYNLAEMPHFIEDVLINREMIKDGYDDYVFYSSYLFLLRKKHVSSLEDYLMVNIPWLSFHGMNDYNSEFLKNMLLRIKNMEHYRDRARKLIDVMKKDLTADKNINYATNAYEVMLCR